MLNTPFWMDGDTQKISASRNFPQNPYPYTSEGYPYHRSAAYNFPVGMLENCPLHLLAGVPSIVAAFPIRFMPYNTVFQDMIKAVLCFGRPYSWYAENSGNILDYVQDGNSVCLRDLHPRSENWNHCLPVAGNAVRFNIGSRFSELFHRQDWMQNRESWSTCSSRKCNEMTTKAGQKWRVEKNYRSWTFDRNVQNAAAPKPWIRPKSEPAEQRNQEWSSW